MYEYCVKAKRCSENQAITISFRININAQSLYRWLMHEIPTDDWSIFDVVVSKVTQIQLQQVVQNIFSCMYARAMVESVDVADVKPSLNHARRQIMTCQAVPPPIALY